MDGRVDRRELLAAIGAGASGVFAGCALISSEEETPGGSVEGATTEDPPERTTTDESDEDEHGGFTADAWPLFRGTAGSTGASSTGGPSADATRVFEVALRGADDPPDYPPVIGPERLYAVARNAPVDGEQSAATLYAYCHSRSDGQEVWRVPVDHVTGPATEDFARVPRACLDSEGLYVLWARTDGNSRIRIRSLSPADGSTRWDRTFPGAAQTYEPVVYDGTLYYQHGVRLVALDTADGRVRWRSETRNGKQPIPVVGEQGAVDVDSDRVLSLYDRTTGTVRWTASLPAAAYTWPAIAGETIYLSWGGVNRSADGEPDRPPATVRALSTGGRERWRHAPETAAMRASTTNGWVSNLTVTPRHVYYGLFFTTPPELTDVDPGPAERERIRTGMYDGPNVVALERTDGSVAWRTTVGPKARIITSMTAGPDRLYVPYSPAPRTEERRKVYVIDRDDGSVEGAITVPTWNFSKAIAGGRLYGMHEESLLAWE